METHEPAVGQKCTKEQRGKRTPYKENGSLSPLLERKEVPSEIQMLKDTCIVSKVLQVGQALLAPLKSLALQS